MTKITYRELVDKMQEFNAQNPSKSDTDTISAIIVFSSDNWEKNYTLAERSYRVTNANRLFQAGKISSSLFGDCLDGHDLGVRLDWYRWKVEYCYFE